MHSESVNFNLPREKFQIPFVAIYLFMYYYVTYWFKNGTLCQIPNVTYWYALYISSRILQNSKNSIVLDSIVIFI